MFPAALHIHTRLHLKTPRYLLDVMRRCDFSSF
jgi:hypothetical protein